MPTRLAPIAIVALLLTACPPPPEVPEVEDQPDLGQLCRSLFAHHPDEDHTRQLEDLAWLEAWLEDFEAETLAGYQVEPLSEDAVDALDEQDRTTQGMIGVVVGSSSAHPVADAAHAMVAVDQEEIHASSYSDYQVEYLSDLDCFLEQSCERLELLEDYTAHFILGVQSVNHTHNQYLWLETDAGLAMLHRAWLPTPPEVNMSWLEIEEQFYLDVFLPRPDGHFRVQTTWLVNSQDSMGEDTVMNMVVSGMQEHSENLEAWLDGR
jgi:hypothetical protein